MKILKMKNENFIRAVLSSFLLLTMFINNSCETNKASDPIKATGVVLDIKKSTLTDKGSVLLKATISPADATDNTLVWTISDDKVASVTTISNNYAYVQAKATGTAKVTATYKGSSTISDTCLIIVSNDIIRIYLNKNVGNLKVNQSETLKVDFLPKDLASKEVTWTSSDDLVADVVNGVVTGRKPGVAKITVTSVVNTGFTDTCLYTVTRDATGLSLNLKELSLQLDQTEKLTALPVPSDAVLPDIYWESSGSEVVVSSDGMVTAKAETPGVYVRARFQKDKTIYDSCKVSIILVKIAATSVTLSKKTLELKNRAVSQLTTTVAPADATNKKVIFESSNVKVATVDQDGNVMAVADGTANIIARSSTNTSARDTCKVTVNLTAELYSFGFITSNNPGLEQNTNLVELGLNFKGTVKYFATNSLRPTFTTSAGAKVYIGSGSVIQNSGNNLVDFTSPVIYRVESADGTVKQYFRISINFQNDTLNVDEQGGVTCKPNYAKFISTLVLADSMNGNNIVYIESRGFYQSPLLGGKLVLPNTLKEINYSAFTDVKFTGSLIIPSGVTDIKAYAFDGCNKFSGNLNLASAVNLTVIGDFAFNGCSGFTGNINIPNTVKVLGDGAFSNCSGFNGTLTIGSGVPHIGVSTFDKCSNLTGDITIPDNITYIGNNAFNLCSKFNGSISIGNNVEAIGDNAFSGCNSLTGGVTFGGNLKSIGNRAFFNCTKLSGDLAISNGVTTIGKSAFENCSTLNGFLTLPTGLLGIDEGVFAECNNLRGDLILPKTIKAIAYKAFYNCGKLTGSVRVPEGDTVIGDDAFNNCISLNDSIILPNSIISIGMNAFSNCNKLIGNLTIPNLISVVKAYSFYQCTGLTGKLVIPASVTAIERAAFYQCGFTGDFTLPNTVRVVNQESFGECKGFNSFRYPSSISQNGFNPFGGIKNVSSYN